MTELNDPHIEQAVAAAAELRREFGIAGDLPFSLDLLELTEGQLGLPVCILDMPSSIAGAYLRKGRGSFIFIQAENFPTRQRFTIAHELGHHRLGHDTVLESYQDVGRDTADPREQQANYFSSELLMPLEGVQSWIARTLSGAAPTMTDLVRLAEEFHASPPAMLYRLSKGEYPGVDRPLLDRLWDEVKAGEHLAIADQLGVEHGDDSISQIFDHGPRPRLPRTIDQAAADRVLGAVRAAFPEAANEEPLEAAS